MKTKTREEFEKVRLLYNLYERKLDEYTSKAHSEVDKLIEYIEKQEKQGFKGLNYILESAKNSIEFEMLDIDDIKDTYSYLLESGTCREIAEEKVLKMLRRLMIG